MSRQQYQIPQYSIAESLYKDPSPLESPNDWFLSKRTGDLGFDIKALNTITIPAKSFERVETPYRFIVPDNNWEPRIILRSHLIRQGCFIPPGLFDPNYTGLYEVIVHNNSNHPITIERGYRFCQVVFYNVAPINNTLDIIPEYHILNHKTNRGEKKYGSTGTKI